MLKGSKFAAENSSIIQNRGRPSNFHLADKNGIVYLCNCCKCIRINGLPKYGFTNKGSKKIKLHRSLIVGKLKVWD